MAKNCAMTAFLLMVCVADILKPML
jgi:hypothetical protein